MNIIHWTKKDTPLIKIILIFIFTSSVEEQSPVKSYIQKPAGGYTFEQVFFNNYGNNRYD
ncbi:MAG: hypothetical protein GXO81_13540 [Chlorobi bacterium]|nr:hypothetical protein [Chlorobiota bacterium]